jgi:glucose-1-phosphate cytidylyltransferase
VAERGRVQRFAEKPKTDGRMSAGYFVFQKEFFDCLGGDDCIMEREPLERLANDGQLMAYQHEGFFYAMDTYREYQHLNDLWNRKAAPWKLWDDAPAQLPRLVNSR